MGSEEDARHQPDSSGEGQAPRAPALALSLTACALRVDACGGIARVVLTQRFVNPHSEPLVVTYRFPMSPDAALSGYDFLAGDRRVDGRVEPKAVAREQFEAALLDVRVAAVVDQTEPGVFSLELGPIGPGRELVAELRLDQKLVWLDEGAWEWRFPTTATPRHVGPRTPLPPAVVGSAAGLDHDDDTPRSGHGVSAPAPDPSVVVASAEAELLELGLLVRDALVQGAQPESPSHALACIADRQGVQVAFKQRAPLDRDIVVRWPVARPRVGVTVDRGRPARDGSNAYALVTIVPPSPEAKLAALARDVTVLIDTSGSMAGKPLEQARRVVAALLDGLSEADRLELAEFASAARRWRPEPSPVTAAAREEARVWLADLNAGGGTELQSGIAEALRPARAGAQRQVIVVSDGAVGFEREVVAAIAGRLPASARLHVVGVGSAVNRSLTSAAARVGRGAEVLIGLNEDAERAASRLLARTAMPLVVDLTIDGSAVEACAPGRAPDLFAGAPVLIAVKLKAEGGDLVIAGSTSKGRWEERIDVPPTDVGAGSQGVVSLFAHEATLDLETDIVSGTGGQRADARLELLGLEYQIATRFTSWVAVSDVSSTTTPLPAPRATTRREIVALPLPFGLSAEAFGLRSPSLPKLGSSMPPGEGDEKTKVTKVVQPTPMHGVRPNSTDCIVVIYTKEPALLGKRFVLEVDPTRIGRGVTNEILLDGDSVSRRHAHIERSRDAWLLVDDGSTNGTYVNDEQISRQVVMRNGDRLKIGSTIFKFLSGEDVEAQYHEEIYRMTIVDGLTQIYNKRYLQESLEREIVRSRRHERDLSVLMIDIDHFKRINDDHGHLAGDFVLKELARLVQTRIRRDEVFARYGGEEFAVILPETSLEGAGALADTLRQKVGEHEFVFHEDTIKVTISIGAAALKEDDRFANDLIRRADERLYAAKNGGRNQVCT